MSDFELQLASLRTEADREIAADGDWADITIPVRLFLELLDALGALKSKSETPNPESPIL